MIRNYITTFIRQLLRQKIYSIINVFGLALGITAFLLIALYIADELSYDRFHQDADRIYRSNLFVKLEGVTADYVDSGPSVAELFRKEIAGVEAATRIRILPITPVTIGIRTINQSKLIYADSNFFKFFSYNLLAGNKEQALTGPNKLVLTESSAKSFFGADDLNGYKQLLGKTILVGHNRQTVEITGVSEDPPSNSHFHFSNIMSLETNDPAKNPSYFTVGDNIYTYIKLSPHISIDQIHSVLGSYNERYFDNEFNGVNGITSLKELRKQGNDVYLHLQPITAIHLTNTKTNEIEPNGNETYLYLLGGIAAFILLLACINFMNLATANAVNRTKEIGIRKTVGAIQEKLVTQFLFESSLCTFLALFTAVTLVSLLIRPFNILVEKDLNMSQLQTPAFIGGILVLTIFISLLAGSYPAFYLSRFKPILMLRGREGISSRGVALRNSLVIFQFFISSGLIMATILVSQQISFLQKLSMGFDKENIVCLSNTLSLKSNLKPFKDELKQNDFIVNACYSNLFLSELIPSTGARRLAGAHNWHTFKGFVTDEDFPKTMKLNIIHGRFFSKESPADSTGVVINETAARLLGILNLDKNEDLEYIDGTNGTKAQRIIGIIQDFYFESLKNEIGPLVIGFGGSSRMSIRIKPGDLHSNLVAIEEIWKKHSSAPFEYSFLNKNLDAQYKSEQQLSKITFVFTSISIIVACLGLLGLVTFICNQRTKEIG